MHPVISFTIDMPFDSSDRTESQASIKVDSGETLRVSEVYNAISNSTFEDIKQWSLWFINFVDQHDLVNDHATGSGRTAPLIGVLLAASRMLQMQSETMARQEMQAVTEQSQFGMEVSNALADQLSKIYSAADAAASLTSTYKGILGCRSLEHHVTDVKGNSEPYSEEEKLRYKLMEQERIEALVADFDQWQEQNKK